MKIIMFISLVILTTSCSIFYNEQKVNNLTKENKVIERKNELKKNIQKNKEIEAIENTEDNYVIEKKETIDMLKYQLSLEEDFVKIPKIKIKKVEYSLSREGFNSLENNNSKKNSQNLLINNLNNAKIEKEQKGKIFSGQAEKLDFFKKDYFLDNSIFKYTDNKVHYNNLLYIPENLVNLKGKYLYDAKKNSEVRKITLEKLNLLSEKYYKEFGLKLKIVSAYRSYNYQKGIKDRGCSDLFCAKAGYSEHQSGLAVDFWEATEEKNYNKNKKLKKYFDWMKINGPKHGFTNTYQKGREIDGYAIEPWHWRYVGEELALYLYKKKLTFAEFFYSEVKKNPPF